MESAILSYPAAKFSPYGPVDGQNFKKKGNIPSVCAKTQLAAFDAAYEARVSLQVRSDAECWLRYWLWLSRMV
jgi:hypothetical protein